MIRQFRSAKIIFPSTQTIPRCGQVEIDDGGIVTIKLSDETICTHISRVIIFANVEAEEPATNGHIHCTICDERVPTAEYSTHLADYHQLPF